MFDKTGAPPRDEGRFSLQKKNVKNFSKSLQLQKTCLYLLLSNGNYYERITIIPQRVKRLQQG
jgi:hypothetical protein